MKNQLSTDSKQLKIKPLYQWRLTFLIPIIGLLMLLLTYLIYNNYTVEQTNQLQQLISEEANLKQSIAYKYRLLKSLATYEQKLAELNQLESVVNQKFPSSDDLPNLLIQINQLAEDNNIAVNSLIPSNLALANGANKTRLDKSKIMAKSFTLTATANYLDFTRFVYAIANLPRVIRIDNLHISRINDDKVNISLYITIYYSS